MTLVAASQQDDDRCVDADVVDNYEPTSTRQNLLAVPDAPRGVPIGLPFIRSQPPTCSEPQNYVIFELAGSMNGDRSRAVTLAKQACQRCPYLFDCREWALEHGEPWGIWGGMSAKQRQKARKEQQRPTRKARRKS